MSKQVDGEGGKKLFMYLIPINQTNTSAQVLTQCSEGRRCSYSQQVGVATDSKVV